MKNKSDTSSRITIKLPLFAVWFLGVAILICSNGCGTTKTGRPPDYDAHAGAKAKAVAKADPAETDSAKPDPTEAGPAKSDQSESLVLSEGDAIRISFPGASSLDTVQQIRRDGKVTLSDGTEMEAAGKTPSQLEKDLIDHFASQLVSKEVTVTVQHSAFSIYVQGAVLKPGKIMVDHPMTALEAINEAGGFDFARADLKKVKIVREKPAGSFTLNFKGLLQGEPSQSFYLKPNDLVYVSEKFVWF